MTIPNWYQLLVLSAASFRVWHLVAQDKILDEPRHWLLGLGNWRVEGDPIPPTYHRRLGEFLMCSWCLGFWIALAWWGAFQWSPHWSVLVAAPFAISMLVGWAGEKI